MEIARDTVVSLDAELWDLWGQLIERSEEPIQYLHGGYGDIFPAVEAALEGRAPGVRVEVRLEPEDAFGDYDADLLKVEPRAAFPAQTEVGMRFEGRSFGDEDPDRIYSVTDIAGGKVVLDGNHPLAGMALKFIARVISVRPASAEELEHRSAEDERAFIMRPLP